MRPAHLDRFADLGRVVARLRTTLDCVWISGRNLALRILPSKFDDPVTEALFLQDYRLAGLRSTTYACSVALAGYVAIGAVDIFFNGWSVVAAARRLILIVLLALIIGLILVKPGALIRRYNVFLGSLGLVAYVSSVSVTHLFRDGDPTQNVSPTALLGLWILYGFFRLPLQVTIFLGLVGGTFALFGSRVTNMHDPTIRTFIYLIIANALGITFSRSVELRERQLFLNRRVLEVAQTELHRRSMLAEQASAEKTRLIAAVGHDLRQPMMAATLHASVLMRRLDARDLIGVQRQADRIAASVKLLGATLEHLLLAARYEAGTEPITIRTIVVVDLFQRLVDLSEAQVTEKGSTLLIRMPQPSLTVASDEQVLLRALVNLVSNAIKFTKPGTAGRSRVVVRASARNGICRIVVADNGIGIAESDIDAIWQPFFQVGNSERNRNSGLGLGLYLVRQSILRLDGHAIFVSSVPGKGTRFVVTVPSHDLGLQSSPCAMSSPTANFIDESVSSDVLRGMYVLLIEDDHEAREAFEAQLDEWGILWSSARNMEEILQSHGETDRIVDAIIADYRLPGDLTGIDLIRAIRISLGHEPDAILITAEVDQSRLVEILPVKTSFLQKPFDPIELRLILGSILARSLKEENDVQSSDPSE